jgi:hypothetical protein
VIRKGAIIMKAKFTAFALTVIASLASPPATDGPKPNIMYEKCRGDK